MRFRLNVKVRLGGRNHIAPPYKQGGCFTDQTPTPLPHRGIGIWLYLLHPICEGVTLVESVTGDDHEKRNDVPHERL